MAAVHTLDYRAPKMHKNSYEPAVRKDAPGTAQSCVLSSYYKAVFAVEMQLPYMHGRVSCVNMTVSL